MLGYRVSLWFAFLVLLFVLRTQRRFARPIKLIKQILTSKLVKLGVATLHHQRVSTASLTSGCLAKAAQQP